MEEDDLAQCRTLYYMGMYDACTSRCVTQEVGGQLQQQEKEALLCACRLQQSFQQQGGFPPDELQRLSTDSSSNPFLHPVALYGLFLEATNHSERLSLYQQLRDVFLQQQRNSFSAFFAACAAAVLQRYTEALEITFQVPVLEMQVLRVQLLLHMNRGDLAQEAADKLAAQNDDCCLGKFAQALVYTTQHNAQEAYLSFGDIQTLCQQDAQHAITSSLLSVGKGAANMQRRMWIECMEDLTKAYQQTPCNADVLVNLICCCRNTRKHADADFFYGRLKSIASAHSLVQKMNELDAAFASFGAGATTTAAPVATMGRPVL